VVLPTRIEEIAITEDEDLLIETVVAELARCSAVRYKRLRHGYAEMFGFSLKDLDELVRNARRGADHDTGEGMPIVLWEPEPWPAPVDGAQLFDNIVTAISTYLVMPITAIRAIALWIGFAYLFEVADHAPKLILKSIEKRSGKTLLLRLISYLVPRPKFSSNITPAAMFRLITAHRPTMLIDETDSFLRGNEDLRNIVNSGFDKDSARVTRTIRNGNGGLDIADFSTWCPQVLAGIGDLADTILDRSVTVTMVRKLKSQTVPKFRARNGEPLRELACKAARWAQDQQAAVAELIAEDRVGIPEQLNDRQSDAWEILLAIAQKVGGPWPDHGCEAALELCAAGDDASKGITLLRDLRALFEEKGVEVLFSDEIVEALLRREDRNYSEFSRRGPLTKNRLARFLRGYRVPTGQTVWRGEQSRKGYERAWLDDAFERYL
jgi:putative DNA primase/helicase